MWTRSVIVLALILPMTMRTMLGAQECDIWIPGPLDTASIAAGTNGLVLATTTWDPDGGGVLGPRLVIGGTFSSVEGLPANLIAMYSPEAELWLALPGLTGGAVHALTVFDGELIAGGTFTSGNLQGLARWDGTAWQPVGGLGVDPPDVRALAVFDDTLIVAGGFDSVNHLFWQPAKRIAQWDGRAWTPLDLNVGANDVVRCLAVYDGELLAGGKFESTNPPIRSLARLGAGNTWTEFEGGVDAFSFTTEVNAMTIDNNDLVIGGLFTKVGPSDTSALCIARWNGAAWSALGPGLSNSGFAGRVLALRAYQSDLIVGGQFTNAGLLLSNALIRWDGSAWNHVRHEDDIATPGSVYCLGLFQSKLIIGGQFSAVDGQVAGNLASWNGNLFDNFGKGFVFSVNALATVGSRLVMGGEFVHATSDPGVNTQHLIGWNGQSLSGGFSGGTSARVNALKSFTAFTTNYLVAGGDFTQVGSVPVIDPGAVAGGGITANRIAMWNDGLLGGWEPMGDGFNATVHAIERVTATQFFDAVIYAGGAFTASGTGSPAYSRIASWADSVGAWSPMGTGFNGTVRAIKSYNTSSLSREVYAGGDFTTASGVAANRIAHWHVPNSSGWVAMGNGFNGSVYTIERHNGSIYAGGAFTTSGATEMRHVARWNGTAWEPVGSPFAFNSVIFSLRSVGDYLYAAGAFTHVSGVEARGVVRWDGKNWEGIGDSMVSASARALTLWQDKVAVGGQFGFIEPSHEVATSLAFIVPSGLPSSIGTPEPKQANCGSIVIFQADVPPDFEHLEAYQWQKDGEPIQNGSTASGSHINGAVGGNRLVIGNVGDLDAGEYRLVAQTACGFIAGGTASLSLTGVCDPCPSDIVSSATLQPPPDGVIDGADLAYLLGEWGMNPGSLADVVTSATLQPPPDGIVDGADLAFLIGSWGSCD